ncbi:putative MIP18 family protein [Blattamonas nauphoetae]|uniref:MIP18 family protein n=1 Tax=Blattamonas nauphoetae TaxID=2049346 RepID=A0ABQ9XDD8_9EUKA|nr:putative MIP18 family protein [Blattamonas nauphoetae]
MINTLLLFSPPYICQTSRHFPRKQLSPTECERRTQQSLNTPYDILDELSQQYTQKRIQSLSPSVPEQELSKELSQVFDRVLSSKHDGALPVPLLSWEQMRTDQMRGHGCNSLIDLVSRRTTLSATDEVSIVGEIQRTLDALQSQADLPRDSTVSRTSSANQPSEHTHSHLSSRLNAVFPTGTDHFEAEQAPADPNIRNMIDRLVAQNIGNVSGGTSSSFVYGLDVQGVSSPPSITDIAVQPQPVCIINMDKHDVWTHPLFSFDEFHSSFVKNTLHNDLSSASHQTRSSFKITSIRTSVTSPSPLVGDCIDAVFAQSDPSSRDVLVTSFLKRLLVNSCFLCILFTKHHSFFDNELIKNRALVFFHSVGAEFDDADIFTAIAYHIFVVHSQMTLSQEGQSFFDTFTPLHIYDFIKDIIDPELPQSIGELGVVTPDQIFFNPENRSLFIAMIPTVKHCSMTPLIALCIRSRLSQLFPSSYRIRIVLAPDSHNEVAKNNRQLEDKERTAAAFENPNLQFSIKKGLLGIDKTSPFCLTLRNMED